MYLGSTPQRRERYKYQASALNSISSIRRKESLYGVNHSEIHLVYSARLNGTEIRGSKHGRAPDFRILPLKSFVWAELADPPLDALLNVGSSCEYFQCSTYTPLFTMAAAHSIPVTKLNDGHTIPVVSASLLIALSVVC